MAERNVCHAGTASRHHDREAEGPGRRRVRLQAHRSQREGASVHVAILTVRKHWLSAILIAVVGIGAAVFAWYSLRPKGLPDGFASGNGRIEAVEIDIAAKTAGRVKAILVNEGDFVTAGQLLAQMDTAVLDAQRREAQARLRQAENAIETAHSQVVQRQSEKAAARAVVIQREAEVDAARRRLARAESLVADGAISTQQLDDDRAGVLGTEAGIRAAESQIAATDAAIATANPRRGAGRRGGTGNDRANPGRHRSTASQGAPRRTRAVSRRPARRGGRAPAARSSTCSI